MNVPSSIGRGGWSVGGVEGPGSTMEAPFCLLMLVMVVASGNLWAGEWEQNKEVWCPGVHGWMSEQRVETNPLFSEGDCGKKWRLL